MSDLSEAQAAQQVKIVGSDPTGLETNEVNATANGLQVDVKALPSIPAGTNNIGSVNIASTPDASITGTITAADTVVAAPAGDGTLRTGASTTGSYVALACPGGDSAWIVQLTGTMSGIYYFEGSIDSTNGVNGNWTNINGRQTGLVNTQLAGNTTTPGFYRGNTSGLTWFRVRNVGGTSPNTSIKIELSSGIGAVFLNASIPVGTNIIGQVYSTSASGNVAAVNGFNRLQVSIEPSDLLSDKFDTLDTSIRWNLYSAGGASSPVGGGNLNMTGGTASGSYTILESKPTFTQKANVQLSHGVTLKYEIGPIVTGAHRFWGFGTAGANTVANPLTDAVGWEISTTGTLNAVIYAGGTKIYSQALTIPVDGKYHRYSLTWRTDKVTFYLDSGDIPSATANGFIPNVQSLPARFHVISGTVSTAPTIQVAALGVSDTGRNSVAISDGVHGFRKATVNSDGSFNVSGSVASGQPDASNPVKIGGVYNSTLPSVSSGSRVDLQLDQNGRLLTSTSVTSSLPAASISNQVAINAGVTQYTTYTATQKLALKQFYAGGTGIGKQVLYSYWPNASSFINSGDFETSGDVANWPYFSFGGGGAGTAALSTAQFHTGTSSVAITFTNGSANNSNGVKQTFSTPVDYSSWRYVSCWMYNPALFSGEATNQTRTITIMLTDSNASTRSYATTYSTGTMTTGWMQLKGEINNPTSATGTAFDSTAIASIELRFVNSANKAGTVYFDTAQVLSQAISLFPIYHPANVSFNVAIDPIFIMNIGDQILIAQTNNDTTRKEFFALTSGVSII